MFASIADSIPHIPPKGQTNENYDCNADPDCCEFLFQLSCPIRGYAVFLTRIASLNGTTDFSLINSELCYRG